MKAVMLKIVPPLWMLICIATALAVHYLIPAARVFDASIPMWGTGLSIVILAVGWGITLHASKIFAEEKTEIIPTSAKNSVLVVRGPYTWSRNPMYVGLLLMKLGIALYMGTLPLYLAIVMQFLILNFLFVPFEEEKMERQFGEQYVQYKGNVRRWF
jgi:protein-S-isoprenylcysteine O-methyltransferase Ste14